MDGAGVDCRCGHGHEGIGIQHLGVVEPGVCKTQLLSTFNDLPGICCGATVIPKSMVFLLRMSSADGAREACSIYGWWRASGTHQVTFFASTSRKMRYNLCHGDADKYTIALRGARALGHTALLGLGLITFAIDASNTQLILPQVMTTMRVDL